MMNNTSVKVFELSASDPLYHVKKDTIDSMNRISDLIRENHRSKWSDITFILTIISSIFIGLFVNSKTYWAIYLIVDLLLVIYIIRAFGYYSYRRHLAKAKKNIHLKAKRLGIPT